MAFSYCTTAPKIQSRWDGGAPARDDRSFPLYSRRPLLRESTSENTFLVDGHSLSSSVLKMQFREGDGTSAQRWQKTSFCSHSPPFRQSTSKNARPSHLEGIPLSPFRYQNATLWGEQYPARSGKGAFLHSSRPPLLESTPKNAPSCLDGVPPPPSALKMKACGRNRAPSKVDRRFPFSFPPARPPFPSPPQTAKCAETPSPLSQKRTSPSASLPKGRFFFATKEKRVNASACCALSKAKGGLPPGGGPGAERDPPPLPCGRCHPKSRRRKTSPLLQG